MSLAPLRAVSAWPSNVLTVRWAAEMKPSKACFACSTLFSAKARISGWTSKFSFILAILILLFRLDLRVARAPVPPHDPPSLLTRKGRSGSHPTASPRVADLVVRGIGQAVGKLRLSVL